MLAPTRKVVKIYSLVHGSDRYRVILDLFMNEKGDVEGGPLTPIGKQFYIQLQKETIIVNGKELSIDDGEKFLEALCTEYNTPYLLASKYEPQFLGIEKAEKEAHEKFKEDTRKSKK